MIRRKLRHPVTTSKMGRSSAGLMAAGGLLALAMSLLIRADSVARPVPPDRLGRPGASLLAAHQPDPVNVPSSQSSGTPSAYGNSLTQSGALTVRHVLGGAANALVVADGRAYVGIGARVYILSLDDPLNPTVLSQTEVFGGPVLDLVLDGGDTLYVALSGAGVAILDVSNRLAPTVVGRLTPGGTATRVVLVGTTAYVVMGLTGVVIADVSDRTQPRQVGHFGQFATDLVVHGDFAYMVSRTLTRWNVSDPAQPRSLDEVVNWADAVALDGDTMYVAESDEASIGLRAGRLQAFDVSGTRAARPLDVVGLAGPARHIQVNGSELLVLAGPTLHTFDIGNPGQPRQTHSVPALESAQRVAVVGNWAYLAAGGMGLRAVDRRNNSDPLGKRVLPVLGRAETLALGGGRLYVEDADLRVLVFAVNGTTLDPVGEFAASAQAGTMTVDGDYLFMSAPDRTLRIYNVKDPAAVFQVSSWPVPESSVARIGVQNGFAFLAAHPYLRIIDVRDPAHPKRVQEYGVTGGVTDLALGEGIAYVTGPATGLQPNRPSFKVVNIADPYRPRGMSVLPAISLGYGVATEDNLVYIDGLQIVDACNPSALVELSRQTTPDRNQDIAVDRGRVYLAKRGRSGGGNLRLLDARDPLHPQEIGVLQTSDTVEDVVAADGFFYASAREAGLIVGEGPAWAAPTPVPIPTLSGTATPIPGLDLRIFLPRTQTGPVGRRCPWSGF